MIIVVISSELLFGTSASNADYELSVYPKQEFINHLNQIWLLFNYLILHDGKPSCSFLINCMTSIGVILFAKAHLMDCQNTPNSTKLSNIYITVDSLNQTKVL